MTTLTTGDVARTNPNVRVVESPQSMMIDTESIPWTDVPGMPGSYSKILHVDYDNDRVTSLFKLDPGVQLPVHKHTGGADTFCISGSFTYQAGTITAGGYGWEPGGLIHEPEASDEGCVLFIVSYGSTMGYDEAGQVAGVLDIDMQLEAAAANNALGHLKERGLLPPHWMDRA